jgi:hypothetical protein
MPIIEDPTPQPAGTPPTGAPTHLALPMPLVTLLADYLKHDALGRMLTEQMQQHGRPYWLPAVPTAPPTE